MVLPVTDAMAGGGKPGENKVHRLRPPAGITPIFTLSSRITSVIGIKYPKKKFFRSLGPGHDKIAPTLDVDNPGESMGLTGRHPGGDRLMLWSSRTDIFS
jgi:hypothetical protein